MPAPTRTSRSAQPAADPGLTGAGRPDLRCHERHRSSSNPRCLRCRCAGHGVQGGAGLRGWPRHCRILRPRGVHSRRSRPSAFQAARPAATRQRTPEHTTDTRAGAPTRLRARGARATVPPCDSSGSCCFRRLPPCSYRSGRWRHRAPSVVRHRRPSSATRTAGFRLASRTRRSATSSMRCGARPAPRSSAATSRAGRCASASIASPCARRSRGSWGLATSRYATSTASSCRSISCRRARPGRRPRRLLRLPPPRCGQRSPDRSCSGVRDRCRGLRRRSARRRRLGRHGPQALRRPAPAPHARQWRSHAAPGGSADLGCWGVPASSIRRPRREARHRSGGRRRPANQSLERTRFP
jgi:hypothetical protein